MTISRRRMLATTSALSLTAACTRPETTALVAPSTPAPSAFQHGVASGDPLVDRVIIWTRVMPDGGADDQQSVLVHWELSLSEGFSDSAARGSLTTTAASDYTVKVDVTGLRPGQRYFYRFHCRGQISPTGRTKTAVTGSPDAARFAVASCANFPYGFFNVYRHIAAQNELDAVIHLGDYLYEYGARPIANDIARAHQPTHEILSLADYRLRHAQYKGDPDLQAAHAAHPWIVVWDDHESANNASRDAAKNHQPEEGDWQQRKAVASQAYREWMPIRDLPTSSFQVYRSFQFGDLLDLLMLDTRLHGRSKQLALDASTNARTAPDHQLLGADQQAWLQRQLQRSKARGARWRMLGQQVMLGHLLGKNKQALNMDQWDGYPSSRRALFETLQANKITNNIVLTGDMHSAWALDVTEDPFAKQYNPATGSGVLGTEFVTPSVTSVGRHSAEEAPAAERALLAANPHIKFVNFRHRGYLAVTLTPSDVKADFWLADDVTQQQTDIHLGARYVVPVDGYLQRA